MIPAVWRQRTTVSETSEVQTAGPGGDASSGRFPDRLGDFLVSSSVSRRWGGGKCPDY